jgi:hypothetical protein
VVHLVYLAKECSCDHHPFGDHVFQDGLRITLFDNDGRPVRLKAIVGTNTLFYEFMRRRRQRGEKNNRTFVTKGKIWKCLTGFLSHDGSAF